MNPRFARLRPELTVGEAILYLRKEAPTVDEWYYAMYSIRSNTRSV